MNLRFPIHRVNAFAAVVLSLAIPSVWADEGGISFWLPGQMSSLAAVPGEPGWVLPMVYLHSSSSAGAGRVFPRGGRVTAGVDGTADILLVAPTYTFAAPVAGGQASLGVGIGGGRPKVGVDATLTGPGGVTRTGSESDSRTGWADLYPTGSLKWNRGVHNYMAYVAGGVPAGSYSASRLANLGLNHWSLDAGGGYTYLNPKSGMEFSAVLGFTYNFENHDTNYRNGVDGHLDWAASYFFKPTMHAGVAGYFYRQVSGDSGSGATLGGFKSSVNGIGPQIGYMFQAGGKKYYANLRAYKDFSAKNRAEGWSIWATLVVPLGK